MKGIFLVIIFHGIISSLMLPNIINKVLNATEFSIDIVLDFIDSVYIPFIALLLLI